MKRAWLLAGILAPTLLGASTMPPRHSSGGVSAPGPAGKAACALPPGWSAVAARKTQYIVFGEMHGTREAPAFVGTVACSLARKGKRLLMAVEHSATDNEALQAAWRLPAQHFPAALRQTGWKGRSDGVASQAMFELLVRLHALKSEGRRIDIVAFNGARDEEQRARFKQLPGQGPHEAAQAENIRLAAEAKRYNHVLVLVGNLHARKQPVVRGSVGYEPMAMRLAPGGAITSLNMVHGAGTMWNCRMKAGFKPEPGKPVTSEAIECASHATSGGADLRRSPFVALGPVPGSEKDPAYDGFFWVGPVSGSPPAVAGGE